MGTPIGSEPRAVATGSYAQLEQRAALSVWSFRSEMIRSHPPLQAACPLGDPGPLAVLTLECLLLAGFAMSKSNNKDGAKDRNGRHEQHQDADVKIPDEV